MTSEIRWQSSGNFNNSGNLNDIMPLVGNPVTSQIISNQHPAEYSPVNNFGQRVTSVRNSLVGQHNRSLTAGSYIQQPMNFSGAYNQIPTTSYIQQPQKRSICSLQQPQQVVTQRRQPSQVIEVVQQPQQIVQRPQQTVERITEVREQPEIIERIIEKVIPKIVIEERIKEVAKPKTYIRHEIKLLANIQEKIVYKEVEQIVERHIPGQNIVVDKPVHVEYEETEHIEVENHKVTQIPIVVQDHVAVAKLQGQISILEQLIQNSVIPGVKTNVYDSKMRIGTNSKVQFEKQRVIGSNNGNFVQSTGLRQSHIGSNNGNFVQSTGLSSSGFSNKFHSN